MVRGDEKDIGSVLLLFPLLGIEECSSTFRIGSVECLLNSFGRIISSQEVVSHFSGVFDKVSVRAANPTYP